MGILFTVMIMLSISILILFIVGLTNNDSETVVSSIFLAMVLFLFGWAIIGNLAPLSQASREIKCDISITPNLAILSSDGKVISSYNDVVNYTYLKGKESVLVIETGYINMYGTTNWNGKYTIKQ